MARRRRRSEPEDVDPVYDGAYDDEPGYDDAAYDDPAYADTTYAEPGYAEPGYAEPAYDHPAQPVAQGSARDGLDDDESYATYDEDRIERWASSGEPAPAPRGGGRPTVGGSILRAVVAAAVVFGVYAFVTGGQDDPATDVGFVDPSPTLPPLEDTLPSGVPSTVPTGTATGGLPTSDPLASGTLAPTTAPSAGPDGGPPASETSVQVLSGTDDDRYQAAISALQALGYEVVESGPARNPRDVTTVFATAGHEEAAAALIRRLGVGVVEDNPGLTASLDVHVVVGDDFPVDGAGTDAGGAAGTSAGTTTGATDASADASAGGGTGTGTDASTALPSEG